jgi:ubiquinol-cytochrome c reductase cytochrome b subunit
VIGNRRSTLLELRSGGGLLGVLAVVFPPKIGPTPVEGIEVTKPPWPFWWLYTLENWFGLRAIAWGTGILFALLVLLPFLDRSPRRLWRDRPVAIALTVLVIVTLVVLTVLVNVITAEEHL